MEDLGDRIRKIRKEKNLTINELSKKCSLSHSYISQVERNGANPSVGSLKEIANGLGVTLVDFFENDKDKIKGNSAEVIRENRHKKLFQPDTEIQYKLLSPDLQGDIEFLLIIGPARSNSGEEQFNHIGEEYGYIIEGVMDVYVDGKKYILEEGDSIKFNSSKPHRWENSTDEKFVAVWAVHPPSF